jgi:prevent-host-death family protein
MQQVDLNQVKEHLLELIEYVSRGEEILITKDEQPFARLTPATECERRRQFGSAKGLIEIAEDFDASLEDFREYM